MNDTYFLKQAIAAGNKLEAPYNFGALVVKDGQILVSDCNHVHETNDPTAHAEISAIRLAAKKIGSHNLAGCTLYASHEPCVMCFSAAVWAGIDRVVYAISASEQPMSYEYQGVDLQDLAARISQSKMLVEHQPRPE